MLVTEVLFFVAFFPVMLLHAVLPPLPPSRPRSR